MSFKAVDVSNLNGTVNMQALKNAGYDLVILRCTEGTSGKGSYDENYVTNFKNARAVGLLVGAYHFARFQTQEKCDSEVENFLNHVLKPDMIALDQEQTNLPNGFNITDLSLRFMDKVAHVAPTLFYCYPYFLRDHCDRRITKYGLWIAHYGVQSPLLTYYKDYAIWQYTDKGRVTGVTSNLDLNTGKDEFLNSIKGGSKYVPVSTTGSISNTSSNNVISTIQSGLNSKYGVKIGVDGISGPATKSAIIKGIQTELNKQFGKKIAIDGIYGSATEAALSGVIVKKGAQGNFTWLIQALLAFRGWSIDVDGIYGQTTYNKILAFQQEKKLGADGIVGQATLHALLTASL